MSVHRVPRFGGLRTVSRYREMPTAALDHARGFVIGVAAPIGKMSMSVAAKQSSTTELWPHRKWSWFTPLDWNGRS